MAVRLLNEGDLVLVDAPLATAPAGESDTRFFLCDYPPVSRHPEDGRLLLRISPEVQRELAAVPAVDAGWHPFCRALGIVRLDSDGASLQPLQFQFRSPRPDEHRYDHHASWPETLLDEVADIKGQPMEIHWLAPRIELAERLTALEHAGASSERAPAAELRRRFKSMVSDTDVALTRRSASPYEGVEAFWCCLASILPAWAGAFPLGPAQRATLLEAYDTTFDARWREQQRRLQPFIDLRYTPEVMDRARAILATAAADAAPAAAPHH
jgi:hypothetical protein